MKKTIGWILTGLLCLALLAGTATADEVYTEGYFSYTVSDGSITIVGYFGNETETTVPNVIAGVPVSTIAAGAFADTTLVTVHLPDTIMTIEEGALGNAQAVWANSQPAQQPESPTPSPTPAAGQTSQSSTETIRSYEGVTPEEPEGLPDDPIVTEAPSAEPTAEPTAEAAAEATEKPAEQATVTAAPETAKTESAGVPVMVWIAVGTVIVLGGGIAAFFVLRRKK